MIERIGRFEIQERRGETAVGRVYRALDPSLNQPVLIKTVTLAPGIGDEAREAIMREARLVGTLSHPNIATVYDVGIEEEFAYLATEFVDGQPLSSLVTDGAPFRPSAIVPWLDQIADGLDYAHRRGVVHRDLTPADIYLTRVGQIKIGDFGLAKMALSADAGRNTPLGNPSYMAPEQVRGEPADSRSDVYALGVVVFELLTAKRPFDGGTLVSTVYKVVNQAPPAAHDLVVGLDPKVDEVLSRALDKDPAKRYATARDLIDALRVVAQSAALRLPTSPTDTESLPTRFCDQCGTGLRANVKFCYRCGAEAVHLDAVEVPAAGVLDPSNAPALSTSREVAQAADVTLATPGSSLRTNPDADISEPPRGGSGPWRPAEHESTVRLDEVAPQRTTERVHSASITGAATTSLPLAGYAASTGTAELPPPGADVDTPPSRMSTLSGLLLPIIAVVAVIVLAGVGGYLMAPRLFGGKRVPISEAPPTAEADTPAAAEPPAVDPSVPAGPFPVAVVPAETKDTVEPELAAGPPDGRFARVAPNGMVTVSFPEGQILKDDGSEKPDLAVKGAGEGVFYIVAVRRADGNYQVIDRVKTFGPSDMRHHKVLETDAVKIINRGTTDLLVDSIEALSPLTPR